MNLRITTKKKLHDIFQAGKDSGRYETKVDFIEFEVYVKSIKRQIQRILERNTKIENRQKEILKTIGKIDILQLKVKEK